MDKTSIPNLYQLAFFLMKFLSMEIQIPKLPACQEKDQQGVFWKKEAFSKTNMIKYLRISIVTQLKAKYKNKIHQDIQDLIKAKHLINKILTKTNKQLLHI